MKTWKKKLSPHLLALLLSLTLGHYVHAATYTLSGATYNPASSFGLYVGTTGITGSFTTASPLPPNLDDAPIAGGTGGLGYVTGWSFNDGVFTYTEANSTPWTDGNTNAGSFAVSTDSAGNITDFFIVLTMPASGAVVGQPTEFLFLGFDGPGTSGADKSICTVLAPDGACRGYIVTTDAASSPSSPATATFSSVCKTNKKGNCKVSRKHH